MRIEQNHFMTVEIGQTVICLLDNGKRVTTGNIIDLLERKSRSLDEVKAEQIRDILIYIRKKSVM